MKKFKEWARSAQNIISFSGGKDSTALYLLALKWKIPFRPVFADTGHEHEWTLDFIKKLPAVSGGPEIEIVKADFADRFKKRREWIAEKWPAQGIPVSRVERVLELLKPTGNPFLDLCMLKGRFPSTKARFCTEELKTMPMTLKIMFPALKNGNVVSWQGVRAQESKHRAKYPRVQWGDGGIITWRPIFHWTHEQVFKLHREMGIDPNPLYKVGMGRVGCMPCIMCQKGEIAIMAQRFPHHVERIAEMESIVAEVSKRGISTFFADSIAVKPEGYNPEQDGYYGIHKIVEWAKTDHGGRQFGFDLADNKGAICSSQYGLCE